MAYNCNVSFDNLSSELQELIYGVIKDICSNIEEYNIDVHALSDKVSMSYDELMDYMINPKNDYSKYLDILDATKKMLGR